MGILKGHLNKIMGLFTGFITNKDKAHQLNLESKIEIQDNENANHHDIWS